jgi:hypothetical protein
MQLGSRTAPSFLINKLAERFECEYQDLIDVSTAGSIDGASRRIQWLQPAKAWMMRKRSLDWCPDEMRAMAARGILTERRHP